MCVRGGGESERGGGAVRERGREREQVKFYTSPNVSAMRVFFVVVALAARVLDHDILFASSFLFFLLPVLASDCSSLSVVMRFIYDNGRTVALTRLRQHSH